MPERLGRALLALFPVLAVALVAAVAARLMAARPDHIWPLACVPILALVCGPRTHGRVVVAIAELAALLPLHAWITLVRAARLEGG
jgi:hypothetical protein